MCVCVPHVKYHLHQRDKVQEGKIYRHTFHVPHLINSQTKPTAPKSSRQERERISDFFCLVSFLMDCMCVLLSCGVVYFIERHMVSLFIWWQYYKFRQPCNNHHKGFLFFTKWSMSMTANQQELEFNSISFLCTSYKIVDYDGLQQMVPRQMLTGVRWR